MRITKEVLSGCSNNTNFGVKLKKIKLVASYSIFLLLIFYFFENIRALEGVKNYILFLTGVSWLFLIICEYLDNKRLCVRKSFFLLSLFLLHIFLRMTFTCDVTIIRPFFASTTGGILVFYFLGSTCYMAMKNFIELFTESKLIKFFLIFLLLFSIALTLSCLTHHSINLRSDIFLIENNGEYQRPGDFATIAFIIISHFFLGIWIKFGNKNKFLSAFVIFIYSINAFLLVILVQMIGSNKGLLCIVNIFICTIGFCLFPFFSTKPAITAYKIRLSSLLLGKNFGRGILSFCFAALIASIISFAFLQILSIDVNKMRVMNFGRGSSPVSGALNSRLGIIENNFLIHFSDSPIIGNMNVDTETTGKGSYVHSIPLYLLSHTGLLGLFLFIIYILFALVEFCRVKSASWSSNFYQIKLFKIFSIFAFVIIGLVGIISSRLPWSPFWFILGLVFSPFDLNKKNDLHGTSQHSKVNYEKKNCFYRIK